MTTATKTTTETTPLPWRLVGGMVDGYAVIGADSSEVLPRLVLPPNDGYEEDLRFAVHCVNNHAQLVTALTDALESLKRLPDVDGAYRQTCIKQAEEALSNLRK